MADYYPLLARALDGVEDPTREAREAVYGRARSALGSQLRAIDPPLHEGEIARELGSLQDAIDRIERSYAFVHRPDEPPAIPIEPVGESRRVKQDKGPAIRRGGKRGRSLLVAAGLVVVIAPIAVAAWLWRDQPDPVPTVEPSAPPAQQTPPTDPKRPERMTGRGPGSAPPETPPRTDRPSSQPPSSPSPTGSAPPQGGTPQAQQQPELPVAQRAVLVEEVPSDPQQPKVSVGRVLWRLDSVNTGQGQPLDTVVRAIVDIPEAKMSLSLVLRKNRDATFPASHTIDLTFTTVTSGEDARSVRDVNPPQLRTDEQQRGIPLAALSVPVKDNVFLIGLSGLQTDIDRNTELLLNRNWIELPVRFGTGIRATVLFEKGVSGNRVMADAFKQWSQP